MNVFSVCYKRLQCTKKNLAMFLILGSDSAVGELALSGLYGKLSDGSYRCHDSLLYDSGYK